MAEDFAIRVDGLYKSFRLPHDKQATLKGTLISLHRRGYEKQEVLKDINLEVKKGEFFGIVGRNGSGKSTLLKLLAGIYSPDAGEVHVRGKLAPFIELGVGFNAELSGRDNVFLNGALLGFSRREMEAMYDEIVEFAELERFMDQKLKNYSSGMQVRLAFSIAIRAETDILLIDEVLAVGDANFQRKCLDKFVEIKESGRTVVFISHDMGAVRKFCDRAVMIQNGKIVAEGLPDEIASDYEVANIDEKKTVESINEEIRQTSNKIIQELHLTDDKGHEKTRFTVGDGVNLRLILKANSPAAHLGVAVYSIDGGYVYGTNTVIDKFKLNSATDVTYRFKADVGRGEYMLKLGVFGRDGESVYEFFDKGPSFVVEANKQQTWEGVLLLDHEWKKSK